MNTRYSRAMCSGDHVVGPAAGPGRDGGEIRAETTAVADRDLEGVPMCLHICGGISSMRPRDERAQDGDVRARTGSKCTANDANAGTTSRTPGTHAPPHPLTDRKHARVHRHIDGRLVLDEQRRVAKERHSHVRCRGPRRDFRDGPLSAARAAARAPACDGCRQIRHST